MADISTEIIQFQTAVYGEEVRSAMVNLAEKINAETEATTDAELTFEHSMIDRQTQLVGEWNTYKTDLNKEWDDYKTDVGEDVSYIQGQSAIIKGYSESAKTAMDTAVTSANTATANAKNATDSAQSASDAQAKANASAVKAQEYYELAKQITGIGIATTATAGIVKPDGTTIKITSDGTISAEGGGVVIDDTLSTTSTNPAQNKAITTKINQVQDAIPTNVSQLNNDANYATTSQLNAKADATDLANYLPLTGGILTGKLTVKGNSSALQTRGIIGSTLGDSTSAGDLYLQYGVNSKVFLGNTGAYNISADGSTYSGTSAKATADANGKNIATTYATKTNATSSVAGLMSAGDKAKLDKIVTLSTTVAYDAGLDAYVASFTNASIGDNSIVDVFINQYGLNPVNITQSGTTLTVFFSGDANGKTCKVVINNN